MKFADHIVIPGEFIRSEISAYEDSIPGMSLGVRLSDAQILRNERDDLSLSKMLLLYLLGGREVVHEISREFSWHHRIAKSDFMVRQLGSVEPKIVRTAVRLLGTLKEESSIPYLGRIFDVNDTEMARCIIETLSDMTSPLSANITMKAFESTDRRLKLKAIRILARWTALVPWQKFKLLLADPDPRIKSEAFFAITLRKKAGCGKLLLKMIDSEVSVHTRRHFIHHIGAIATRKVLEALLKIVVGDAEQKTRLVASRALDRLQGHINPKELYRLRNASDVGMRAEVLFRIGKFGTDNKKYKRYLKRTLETSTDPRITQACLQALGLIIGHDEIDFLFDYTKRDPMTSYNAVMALTRAWRLEDSEKAYRMLRGELSATLKQILLKYLIRRRGFSKDPVGILSTAKELLASEKNLNVRYLTFGLLQFSPCVQTVEFLISSFQTESDQFVKDAIRESLRTVISEHESYLLDAMNGSDMRTCCELVQYAPIDMDESFYEPMIHILFKKQTESEDPSDTKTMCARTLELFSNTPAAIRAIIGILPDSDWRRHLLRSMEGFPIETIHAVRNELVDMLADDDEEVRSLVSGIILKLKDPALVPRIVEIAESAKSHGAAEAAKRLTSQFVREDLA